MSRISESRVLQFAPSTVILKLDLPGGASM
jgi:hypothetical protein